jgi:hypothetical protein
MTKIPVGPGPIYVRYTGLFDFDALYAAIIDWCKSHGYKWDEETYKHKVPSPRGAESEWAWYAEKDVTDYIKYKISMKVHTWDGTEVEVIKDKKKKKLTNARFQIIMNGTIITDWQKRWEKNRFTRFLGRLYEEHIIRKKIENNYHDDLYYRLWNLQAIIKKFFNMQTKWNEYKKYLKED